MHRVKIIFLAMAFIGLSAAALNGNFSTGVSVAQAAGQQGQLLKLMKPAKMHVDASGPSEVSEIAGKGAVATELERKDVWVRVRLQGNGHTGWIHHSYLAVVETVAPVAVVEVPAVAAVVEEKVVAKEAAAVVPTAEKAVEHIVTKDASVSPADAHQAVAGEKPAKAVAKKEASGHHGPVLRHANVDMTDHAQIRRGLTVFTDVCMGCHSAKYLTYRGLMDYPEIGLTREALDELRGEKSLMSGMISDLSIEDAALSYGKVPPDLSLIVPGRRGGADYVYSLLTAYEHDHEGKVPDGNYNAVYAGNRIAMPDPLAWLDHDPGDEAELNQQAEDVAAFLAFIGDPHQNTRRAIGRWVMGFLLLLTFVLWRLKVEVWKDVKH